MQIRIKNGVEDMVLTKTERELLRKASALMASIGRHSVGVLRDHMEESANVVETFLASEPPAEPVPATPLPDGQESPNYQSVSPFHAPPIQQKTK